MRHPGAPDITQHACMPGLLGRRLWFEARSARRLCSNRGMTSVRRGDPVEKTTAVISETRGENMLDQVTPPPTPPTPRVYGLEHKGGIRKEARLESNPSTRLES